MPTNLVSEGLDMGMGLYGGINPIAGNLWAGMKNAEASRAKEALTEDYAANLDAWYNQKANEDFLNTNAASSALTRIYNRMNEQNNLVDKNAATTGATNEASLAAKTNNTAAANEATSQIAAMGTARADQADAQYQQQQPLVYQMKAGILNDKIQAAQKQQENSNQLMNSYMSVLSGGITGLPVSGVPKADYGGGFVDSTVPATPTNSFDAFRDPNEFIV